MTRRTLLNLLAPAPLHGNRSSLTCRYKCGDACFHDVPNTSDNAYFGDIAEAAFSRRSLVKTGAVVAAAASVPGIAALAGATPAAALNLPENGLGFTPIKPSNADMVVIPEGFAQDVVIRWGDPILAGAPEFDAYAQTAAKQAGQFGYNNDYLGFLPLSKQEEVMCVNHEYTDEYIMFPNYDPANPTREQVEVAWAAHGLSVVTVRKNQGNGKLTPVVGHKLNRRFTATSEFAVSGPAKGSKYLATKADPKASLILGTLNNCSGGLTPWGTWLTAEENFNQYFANGAAVTEGLPAQAIKRYGIPTGESERKWERFDDRFDLAKTPNEVHRFGWLVEVDPYDPTSTPVKRTLLGRVKHEAGTCALTADGRVAVYSGDDERFDYLYKFVSSKKVDLKGGFKGNADLLDSGTLYVARFDADGMGEWIALCDEKQSFVPGMALDEVLVFTRLAADKMGATKMDRPEDVEPSPKSGKVYVALTNNTKRKPGQEDAANPRSSNKHGHIVELTEKGDDSAATRFAWDIFLLCGDPNDPSTYFAGFDKSQVSPISCPDNVTFDEFGNLWISTDGNQLGAHDGLYAVAVEGEERGHVKQFLSVPTGAECCGPWVTRERVNVAIQHPGETDTASFEKPTSHWPDGGMSLPRPSIVTAWAKGQSGATRHGKGRK